MITGIPLRFQEYFYVGIFVTPKYRPQKYVPQ